MLFTWFMLGGFIFLFAPDRLTNKFQLTFARIFSWPLSIGRGISLATRARLVTDVVPRREFERLNSHLSNVTQQRDQEHQRVEQLAGLRQRPDWQRMRFVLADIITISDGTRNELTVNRGQEDGLAKDQFVLADNSIIARVSAVSSRTAQVRLFTDPASKIAVKIAGLNVKRVMQGTGNDTGRILNLQMEHKVKKGDEVFAQKEPGFLDTAMIIGRVTQCKRDEQNPMVWDVTVEPVCDIKELTTVAVIVSSP
jgi:rod shape-determining protein MreC